MRHADIRSTEKYFHGNLSKLQDIVNQRGKAINKQVIPFTRKDKK
jgi:hypothetical protein